MKSILVLCGLILAGGVFAVWRQAGQPLELGKFTGAAPVEVVRLVEQPREFMGRTVAVEGTVRRQCKAVGCFFFLLAGEKYLRVELGDIASTVPNKEGRHARVEGQMVAFGDGYQLAASAVEFH
jgi:hypothetical protein